MKRLFFFVSIQLVFLSCATVKFNVEHPPLVDLRGANSITVIPFEWNSNRGDMNLANLVTSSLLSGLRRGNISLVDPYSLQNSYTQNYSRYADVYIFGRIINVRAYDNVQRTEDTSWSDPRIIMTITRTVYVDIEYTYYRSKDNKLLGNYKKTESSISSFEQIRRASERRYQQWPAPGSAQGASAPRRNGRGGGRSPQGGTRVRLLRDEWTNRIAASAILGFADTMDKEIGTWTTRERRSIRGKSAGLSDAEEAKKLVRQGQYNLALEKFNAVYKNTGDVLAGYNTSILLAANNRFTEALGLLQRIDKSITEAGKKSPSYIKNEIKKMTEYINGFKILESASASPPSAASGVSAPKTVVQTESKPEPVTFRTVDKTDDSGRLLSQTVYNNKNETVSEKKYTWQRDRITSVVTTEGSVIKKTEYDYNASGGKTAERDYKNGVLERQVFTQGNREIEELYLNGRTLLRAVWENGVKISEERLP